MIDRYAIAHEARQWIGTRYHHQASLKGVGTDCIGLVAGVAAACGVPEAREFLSSPSLRCYGPTPDPEQLMAGASRFLRKIAIWEARTGDILIFKFRIEPQHFAIISRDDPQYIVHAYAQARRAVENRLDDIWRARILHAFRFRGIV